MDDSATVKVLDTPEDLVEEHLDVVRGQVLGRHDDLVEVTLHQLGYEVDFLKKSQCGGAEVCLGRRAHFHAERISSSLVL